MEQLTTTISPLVIDLFIGAIILVVALLRAKAGIFQCVMAVVVIILSLALGIVGSQILTPIVKTAVWDHYYAEETARKFDEEAELAMKGQKSFEQSFKESWNDLIESFGTDKVDVLLMDDSQVDYSDSQMVEKLRALTLLKAELMVTNLVHMVLFGLMSAIGFFVFTLLKNMLDKVANFSIVGWANHALGFALGLVEIIVILIVIFRGATLLNITFFSDIAEGTVLTKWLVGGDIQSSLTKLQSITFDDLRNIELDDLTTVDFDEVGSEVKDIIDSIDTEALPEEVQDVIDKVDTEQIKDDVEGIVDSIDTEGAKEKVDGVVDGVKNVVDKTKKAVDTTKDVVNTTKDIVDKTKDVVDSTKELVDSVTKSE